MSTKVKIALNGAVTATGVVLGFSHSREVRTAGAFIVVFSLVMLLCLVLVPKIGNYRPTSQSK
jgi:hypothetical protein